jgi:hypothetical protein
MWLNRFQGTLLSLIGRWLQRGGARLLEEAEKRRSAHSDPTPDPSSAGSPTGEEQIPGPPAHWVDYIRQKAPHLLNAPHQQPGAPRPVLRSPHTRDRSPAPQTGHDPPVQGKPGKAHGETVQQQTAAASAATVSSARQEKPDRETAAPPRASHSEEGVQKTTQRARERAARLLPGRRVPRDDGAGVQDAKAQSVTEAANNPSVQHQPMRFRPATGAADGEEAAEHSHIQAWQGADRGSVGAEPLQSGDLRGSHSPERDQADRPVARSRPSGSQVRRPLPADRYPSKDDASDLTGSLPEHEPAHSSAFRELHPVPAAGERASTVQASAQPVPASTETGDEGWQPTESSNPGSHRDSGAEKGSATIASHTAPPARGDPPGWPLTSAANHRSKSGPSPAPVDSPAWIENGRPSLAERRQAPMPGPDLLPDRWPELPEAHPFAAGESEGAQQEQRKAEDEVSARQWRRRQRLDREQRGEWWSESLF